MNRFKYIITACTVICATVAAQCRQTEVTDIIEVTETETAISKSDTVIISDDEIQYTLIDTGTGVTAPDSIGITSLAALKPLMHKAKPLNIYELPYSFTDRVPNWPKLWVNTGILVGAFASALFVLEMLPEDATSWNRASLQSRPFYQRWYDFVIKQGPEWDHDLGIFNWVLHPYAGAAYFMAARSCGFNFYQSLLYSSLISTVGWEFGIEACMERPSLQDIFVTPLVGSFLGEFFYMAKRYIVENDYHLLGTPVLGYIAAFLLDPVNEMVGYFGGNNTHKLHLKKQPKITSSLLPTAGRDYVGFSFSCTF